MSQNLIELLKDGFKKKKKKEKYLRGIIIMTKCIGCGAELQSNDKNLKGYIPLEKSDAIYCERCFRIQHYNKHEHNF